MGRKSCDKPTLRLTTLFIGSRFRELIKDMEVTLVFHLTNNTTLLQEVVRDLRADRFTVVIEHDFEIFPLNDRESNVTSHPHLKW